MQPKLEIIILRFVFLNVLFLVRSGFRNTLMFHLSIRSTDALERKIDRFKFENNNELVRVGRKKNFIFFWKLSFISLSSSSLTDCVIVGTDNLPTLHIS